MHAVSTPIPPGSHAIRIFGEGRDYGDPYDYLLVCEPTDDPDTCLLSGLKSDGNFNSHHAIALEAELVRLGYKKVIWVRIKNGKEHPVAVSLGHHKKAID